MSETLNEEERRHLTRMLMHLFDEWDLDAEARIKLLGLSDSTKPRALNRYSQGEAVPDNGELLKRGAHLLAIHKALELAFPMNDAVVRYWVTTGNTYYDNRSPLEIMLEQGLAGIENVRRHLEATEEW